MLKKAFKVRLYPNKTQALYIAKAIGCVRAIYNMMLHDEKEAYQAYVDAEKDMTDEEKKNHKYTHKISYSGYSKQEQTSYLKEIEARTLNSVQQNLKKAFQNFFKNRDKGFGFPTFKKKMAAGSFQSDKIQVIGRKLKIPKCPGLVPFRNYEDIDFSTLTTKTITISRTSNYKYYASILCDVPDEEPLPKTGKTIGIDLGVTSAVTLDDGRKIDRKSIITKNKFFRGNRNGEDPRVKELRSQIEFYQAKMMKAGVWQDVTFTGKDGQTHTKRKLVQETGNYRRLKEKVAALTEKLNNIRQDYINKVARSLVEEADVICMEDLTIQADGNNQGLLGNNEALTNKQNQTKNRNIAEASMGMIGTKIESMAARYGRTVVKVNPANTTRTCHCCGYVMTEGLATSIREWTCPQCHTHHDRDVNAAKNILARGVAKL